MSEVGTLNFSSKNIDSQLTTMSPSRHKDSMTLKIKMRQDLLFMDFNGIIATTTITTVVPRILRHPKVQVSPNVWTVRSEAVLRKLKGRSKIVVARRMFKGLIQNWLGRMVDMVETMGQDLTPIIKMNKFRHFLVLILKILIWQTV